MANIQPQPYSIPFTADEIARYHTMIVEGHAPARAQGIINSQAYERYQQLVSLAQPLEYGEHSFIAASSTDAPDIALEEFESPQARSPQLKDRLEILATGSMGVTLTFHSSALIHAEDVAVLFLEGKPDHVLADNTLHGTVITIICVGQGTLVAWLLQNDRLSSLNVKGHSLHLHHIQEHHLHAPGKRTTLMIHKYRDDRSMRELIKRLGRHSGINVHRRHDDYTLDFTCALEAYSFYRYLRNAQVKVSFAPMIRESTYMGPKTTKSMTKLQRKAIILERAEHPPPVHTNETRRSGKRGPSERLQWILACSTKPKDTP
jgi:hypothetical protein